MHSLIGLLFRLDRYKPFAAAFGYRDIFRRTFDHAAFAVIHPTDFRQKHAAIFFINLEALRIAETVARAFFLEARKAFRAFLVEGIPQRPIKVFKRLLQRL